MRSSAGHVYIFTDAGRTRSPGWFSTDVRTDGVDDRRASVAATGFGLSALCIAHERGYLKKDDAEQRVERTLDFFARRAFCQRGFYFHFLDCVSGQRSFGCGFPP